MSSPQAEEIRSSSPAPRKSDTKVVKSISFDSLSLVLNSQQSASTKPDFAQICRAADLQAFQSDDSISIPEKIICYVYIQEGVQYKVPRLEPILKSSLMERRLLLSQKPSI